MRRVTQSFGGACAAAFWHRSRRQRSVGQCDDQRLYDVAVIGGGLAGLAVAREVGARGASVVLLEREQSLASGASGGNTGLGHTGYDAPQGSLERSLLRRAICLHPKLYRSFGLSLQHVRKCGSLVVAWTPEQLAQLDAVLQENVESGDVDAYRVDATELRELEPGLSHDALGAVVCPNEAVVEPWLVCIGYAESALRHGAELRLATEVVSARRIDNMWRLGTGSGFSAPPARSGSGQVLVPWGEEGTPIVETGSVLARKVVNCAGVFGDRVEAMRAPGRDPPFHVTPRKGQFVVFKTDVELEHILEVVPTQFTKGVIVWSTVYGNVIVGPTATDQLSRADRSTDAETVDALRAWAVRAVPALRSAEIVGTYSGLRPATEFRDYCIDGCMDDSWVTVGGIRSTGLSACSAIGEHIANMLDEMDGALPQSLPTLGVSESKSAPCMPRIAVENGPVPSLAELAAEYRSSIDATVTVYGRRWFVSHPLSSFGMQAHTGKHSGATS